MENQNDQELTGTLEGNGLSSDSAKLTYHNTKQIVVSQIQERG